MKVSPLSCYEQTPLPHGDMSLESLTKTHLLKFSPLNYEKTSKKRGTNASQTLNCCSCADETIYGAMEKTDFIFRL